MARAKLAWEVQGTSLVLTVTNGPKTSNWLIRKNHTAEAAGAILRGVVEDLTGSYQENLPGLLVGLQGPPVAHPVQGTSRTVNRDKERPSWGPGGEGPNIVSPVYKDDPDDWAEVELKSALIPSAAPTLADQISQLSEEQSLEELKILAYNMAVKNKHFAEDVGAAERSMLGTPEYLHKGHSPIPVPAFSSGTETVYQTVDGRAMTVNDIRQKPKTNVTNHED